MNIMLAKLEFPQFCSLVKSKWTLMMFDDVTTTSWPTIVNIDNIDHSVDGIVPMW
jgi:hypothetical protein